MNVRFDPARNLRGQLRAPADKSISHRAALLGAMCAEPVRIDNFLKAADTKATLASARALGALVEVHLSGVVMRGAGLRGARSPQGPIDVGNAGTLLRILPGWLAGQEGRCFTLDGDQSIRRRPVDRIIAPLRAMGAELQAREDRFAPLSIRGRALHGIEYDLPVASAQVKSCILLAALLAEGRTSVLESLPSRDHTERMLARAGAPITRRDGAIDLCPVDELELPALTVPGDISSAAFFVAAAILVPGSRLLIRDVGVNSTRCGFLQIAQRMGAIVLADLERPDADGAIAPEEPVSDIDVAHGALEGTTVEGHEVPLAIDELPLVALLGCFAEGETTVRGAGELRVKESDRIDTVVRGLRALGAQIEATADGFCVQGTGALRGGVLDAHGDHRLAMLGAIAGLASRDGVEVRGFEVADVSYPRFREDLASLLSGHGDADIHLVSQ
ncbi:MAG TPA: 3-phosphoshikimate 1-carboxyvinyltransferase [Solirubrobacteraceae bacterium]|nr:3-phosphoshikimate 1-carboxyvinyltransferase [Solirubrobacteraceae bacterium]